MSYPDKFIRGVSNPGFVDAEGRPSGEIFKFDDAGRADGFFESSINWYDDDKALDIIMQQRKEKDEQPFQFRYGAAIIERGDADRIINNTLYKDVFNYERSPLDNNPYHGNLLLKHTLLTKQIRTVVAASLALNARLVPREEYSPKDLC